MLGLGSDYRGSHRPFGGAGYLVGCLTNEDGVPGFKFGKILARRAVCCGSCFEDAPNLSHLLHDGALDSSGIRSSR